MTTAELLARLVHLEQRVADLEQRRPSTAPSVCCAPGCQHVTRGATCPAHSRALGEVAG